MNKDKIIKDILLEYSVLSKTGGIDKLDHDLLVTAIENCGYASYFSIPKLVNEIESKKENPGLSNDDIALINQIIGKGSAQQSRVLFDDDDLKTLDLDDPRNKPATLFPKDRGQAELTYNELIQIGKDNGGLKILHSPSSLRIATVKGGRRLSNINTTHGIKDGSKTFGQLMLFLKLAKEHKNMITLGIESAAPGLTGEVIAVNHINDWFKKNNPEQQPFRLHFWDKTERVPTGVEVDDAVHIVGKNKADIALRNQNSEVFWISFKGAEFDPRQFVQRVDRVDFPQYSGMLGLDDSFTDGKVKAAWDSIKMTFLNGIKKNYTVPPLLINPRKTTFDENKVVINLNGKSALETIGPNAEFYTRLTSDFRKMFYDFVTTPSSGKKYLYYMGDKFEGHLDFLDGSEATRIIAGKTIYGRDFDIKGKAPFGQNNCSILMHSHATVEMKVIHPEDMETMPSRDPKDIGSINWVKANASNATSESHLLISTTEGGQLWFNPNLPLPKDAADPILKYRPTLSCRSGTDEAAVLKFGNDEYMFMKFRVVVWPLAKVGSSSVNLKK
jgi:hypothetical protein